jgi:hypothetical protein
MRPRTDPTELIALRQNESTLVGAKITALEALLSLDQATLSKVGQVRTEKELVVLTLAGPGAAPVLEIAGPVDREGDHRVRR